MTARPRLASIALLVLLAIGGCDDSVDVPVTVRAGAGVTTIEAVALPGPCPAAGALESDAVRERLGAEPFTGAGTLPIPGDAESLAAWGLDADCQVVAFACEPLEGEDPIVVALAPIAAYDRCDGTCGADGRCGASIDMGPADLGPPRCGNGRMDPGEACDDGNDVPNDGCEDDCTITCETDEDCAMRERDVCDGTETCDTDTNTCVSMDPLDCDDGEPCTEDSCDPLMGCINDPEPFNMDGDAFTAEACGGTDCDDTDETVFPGAEELCDEKDNNCNGSVDEVAPFWYLDCDGDGFAADTVGAMQTCDEPAPAGACGWTSVRPASSASTDCNDDRPDVNPDATAFSSTPIVGNDFDYDCDGVDTPQYGYTGITDCTPLGGGLCFGTPYFVAEPVTCGTNATLSRCDSSCRRETVSLAVACR